MDHLHAVLRAIGGETKRSSDHLGVFREFLAHLEQVSRKAQTTAAKRRPPRPRRPRRAKG